MTWLARSIANPWREIPMLCKMSKSAEMRKSDKRLIIDNYRNWHGTCKASGIRPSTRPTSKRDHAMFNDFTRKFAALALTVVMSATCVLTAVGPATADGNKAAVAMAARFVA
jgi:hypothetical protein